MIFCEDLQPLGILPYLHTYLHVTETRADEPSLQMCGEREGGETEKPQTTFRVTATLHICTLIIFAVSPTSLKKTILAEDITHHVNHNHRHEHLAASTGRH
jgi:hypothetical protein